MKFTQIQLVLWAAGLVCHVALLAVLFLRGGYRSFRFFTGWITYQIALTVALYFLHIHSMDRGYSYVYWYGQVLELGLLLGIIWDMVTQVLRPEGKWYYGIERPFLYTIVAAVGLALMFTIAIDPYRPATSLKWLYPSNLFCEALMFELGVGITLTANRFGLAWKNRVWGLSTGWLGWSLMILLVEAARKHWAHSIISDVLAEVQMYAYLVTICYWMIVFWRKEPERKDMPFDMRAFFSSGIIDLMKGAEK